MFSKKVFITGGNGFTGRNLQRYFGDKYEITKPRSFELDLTNENSVKNFFKNSNFGCIIHCASAGGYRKNVETTVEDNVAMVENLLKYKDNDTRLILFGSGAMYDKNRELHKVKEEEIGKFIPENLYGLSKLKVSELVKNRKDAICLNIFGCYGYEERETRFPTYAIKQVLNNQPIEINQNVVFDYLFIEDLCKIIEYFMHNDFAENVINVTPSKSITLKEIADIVNSFTDNPVEIKILNPKMNLEYTGDNSLLLKNFPEMDFTPIKTGLKKLFNFIKES